MTFADEVHKLERAAAKAERKRLPVVTTVNDFDVRIEWNGESITLDSLKALRMYDLIVQEVRYQMGYEERPKT